MRKLPSIFFALLILGGIKNAWATADFKQNIYSHAGAKMFSKIATQALPRVYVPNTDDHTITVINPQNYQVLTTLNTKRDPEHIVPAYDLKTLWILNDEGNRISPINPMTGKIGAPIHIDTPYNLYFTLDGHFAIVLNDIQKRFEFRDPQSMSLIYSVPVDCVGLNHMDFTADGRFALASCEMSGSLVLLDISKHKVVKYLVLHSPKTNKHPMPQDVRLSPQGHVFYVADMKLDGVYLIDAARVLQIGFIKTGRGTHSIIPSRDGTSLYIINRGCNKMLHCPKKGPGSITVLNPLTQKIKAQWEIAQGGSPDMGNVSADGNELWLSGKYDDEVYVIDTHTGKVTHRIPVGKAPHGLCIWPQPGRFSLGHTGIMR